MGLTLPEFLIPTYRILDATDSSEWAALSDLNKQIYQLFMSVGKLNLQTGSIAQVRLWAMFGAGTVTGAALRDPANRFVEVPNEPTP